MNFLTVLIFVHDPNDPLRRKKVRRDGWADLMGSPVASTKTQSRWEHVDTNPQQPRLFKWTTKKEREEKLQHNVSDVRERKSKAQEKLANKTDEEKRIRLDKSKKHLQNESQED
ncbi:hypothetical protein J6590_011982 [Homalodisca vitripennis]|nr:hypothetical protein J6590_011982 [Homalodisca vitripennis]